MKIDKFLGNSPADNRVDSGYYGWGSGSGDGSGYYGWGSGFGYGGCYGWGFGYGCGGGSEFGHGGVSCEARDGSGRGDGKGYADCSGGQHETRRISQ